MSNVVAFDGLVNCPVSVHALQSEFVCDKLMFQSPVSPLASQ